MASTGNFRVVFCALMLLLSSVVVAAPKLAISPVGYRIVQATPVAGTNNQFELTARAGVANSGSAAISVSAIITSKTPTVIVLDGNVQFGNVGPTSMQRPIISVDTFKLRVVAPQRPTLQNILQFAQTAINSLSWSVQCNGCGQNRPPIANAGSEKTAFVGVPVVVSGSSSSDPDGNPLTYRWTLLSRPQGSTATLGTAGAVETTLTPDEEGSYVLQLIVNDGIVDSAPSSMSVNTQNSAPIANAGQDQTAAIGSRVTLNGSDSTDANGDSLTYAWRLIDRPETSRTVFLNSDPVSPIADFIVDKPGQYVAELIVSDGTEDSAPDTVIISTSNSIPIANAGLDQTIARGATARLSGVDSFDADGDLLSYRWSLTAPAGSQAQLISANAADTGFHVDGPGTYVLQLIVSDGVADSLADTAVISTINSAPVANAGADLHVYVGETVVLDGLQSIDADDDALAFSWSLINRPVSSTAELVAADNPRATFTADVPGLYVAQLIVNDGRVDSVPDTSQIVIEVRPDTLAPAISVSAPVDGSYTHEASAIVAGQVSEPASLVVNGASVVLGGGNQFSVSVALVEGVNTVALTATDAAGNRGEKSISVIRDSFVPAPVDVTRVILRRESAEQTVVSGAAGSVEPGALVLIFNQRSGVAFLTSATSNGSFEVLVNALATDILSVRVIDTAGNSSVERQLPTQQSNDLEIAILRPMAAAVVDSRYVVVAGTVTGSAEAGVVVNKTVAATRPDGANTAFIARIRLESGSNLITITASTLTAQRIERTLQVTRGEVPIVEVTSNRSNGLAPLPVEFDIRRFAQAMVVQATYDFDGDGQVDKTVLFPEDPETFLYTQAGEYVARVELTLAGQPPREYLVPISVTSSAQLDAKLRETWNRFSEILRAGDVSSATTVLSESVREKYRQILAEYGDDLPWFVDSLSALTPSFIGAEYSEYAITRMLDGQRMAFFVSYVRDPDGVWRISGM